MLMKDARFALPLIAFALLPGCATTDDADEIVAAPDTPGYDDDFARAARVHDVPADLLKAVSYVETQWQMVDGEAEHEHGMLGGSGIFALWGDNLERGASAAGVDVEDARHELGANIAAAAARLAELATEHGIDRDDLAAWAPVLAAFSQIPVEDARTSYANEVLRTLAAGATSTSEDGTPIATLLPHAELESPVDVVPFGGAPDYAGAVWRASPNYSSRGGSGVSLVVIHSCEGSYAGCWGWLRNPSAGASAHYVVKENGGEITQLVRESSKAWHVAANYECSRAGGKQCNKNGTSTNNFSVGIEHAGFASQASWQAGLLAASSKLTCDIARDHGVPRDRNHIVSHGQLQPWNRTDPGPNWPWSDYIDRVRAHCGEGGSGGAAIIVDSNNANNNQSRARMELSGTWTASSSAPGYYGTGYWFANTAATSAPATFKFYLPAAATKTIDAWWTGGSNRSTAAPFIAANANGHEVGRRTVDQTRNGSRWVTLGTWNFSAGWNTVKLSRWTTPGKVVIADAIRVR